MGYKGQRRYGNKRTFLSDEGVVVFSDEAKKRFTKDQLANGEWFDSKWECECWVNLKEMESEGLIYDLSRHKDDCLFHFWHNGIKIATARLDFSFSIEGIERRIIADAKSAATIDFQRFRWQKNMMLAFFDLPVVVFLQGHDHVWQLVSQIREKGLDDYLTPHVV